MDYNQQNKTTPQVCDYCKARPARTTKKYVVKPIGSDTPMFFKLAICNVCRASGRVR